MPSAATAGRQQGRCRPACTRIEWKSWQRRAFTATRPADFRGPRRVASHCPRSAPRAQEKPQVARADHTVVVKVGSSTGRMPHREQDPEVRAVDHTIRVEIGRIPTRVAGPRHRHAHLEEATLEPVLAVVPDREAVSRSGRQSGHMNQSLSRCRGFKSLHPLSKLEAEGHVPSASAPLGVVGVLRAGLDPARIRTGLRGWGRHPPTSPRLRKPSG